MKNKILMVVCILFGLLFINSGLNKFFNYMPMPADMPEKMVKLMAAFVEIGWLLPLVAVTEITAGILFMIPKFRALAALILLPVMTGIVLTNIFSIPSGLPLALALMVIEIWVIIENREKYMHLIR